MQKNEEQNTSNNLEKIQEAISTFRMNASEDTKEDLYIMYQSAMVSPCDLDLPNRERLTGSVQDLKELINCILSL